MSPDPEEKISVQVDGRRLTLSNLHKPMYPNFVKAEVIDYYTRIAPVMLPHLVDRPVTRIRYPDGVNGPHFFEKTAPSHTPKWVRTAEIPTPGSSRGLESIEFVVIDDLPTLVWCANLAALELHVPQWKIGQDGRPLPPDLMVFDLDPGSPAGLAECCEVARLLRELLDADGLTAYPKTSGGKGLHLYVPVQPSAKESATSAYAREAADRLARDRPKLVVSKMDKKLRGGKVFVDWSQNNPVKTTVAPYSLRAQQEPTVSTPVTWEELEHPKALHFTASEVLDRVAELGDLLQPMLNNPQKLP